MTEAPKFPLEHSHTGDENPFESVHSKFGLMERWRAHALQTGELGAMTVLSDHVKNDAVARMDAVEEREAQCAAREEACDQRERALGVTAAKFVDFVGKSAVLFDRLAQAKADAEREPEDLPLPPGHVSELPQPSLNADADTGELPGQEPGEDQAEFPDPELPHPPVTEQPVSPGLDTE